MHFYPYFHLQYISPFFFTTFFFLLKTFKTLSLKRGGGYRLKIYIPV